MDWRKAMLQDAKEMIAERFGISPDNTNGYDWEAGCYCNGRWISPKEFLNIMEDFIEDKSYIFEEYFNE